MGSIAWDRQRHHRFTKIANTLDCYLDYCQYAIWLVMLYYCTGVGEALRSLGLVTRKPEVVTVWLVYRDHGRTKAQMRLHRLVSTVHSTVAD
jgi:hypothetical protein